MCPITEPPPLLGLGIMMCCSVHTGLYVFTCGVIQRPVCLTKGCYLCLDAWEWDHAGILWGPSWVHLPALFLSSLSSNDSSNHLLYVSRKGVWKPKKGNTLPSHSTQNEPKPQMTCREKTQNILVVLCATFARISNPVVSLERLAHENVGFQYNAAGCALPFSKYASPLNQQPICENDKVP